MTKAPPHAGSPFYNYKGTPTHSIVLMAIVNVNYCFVVVDIGAYGRSSDGGTFAKAVFACALLSGSVNLPDDLNVQGLGVMPHVIVGMKHFRLKHFSCDRIQGTDLRMVNINSIPGCHTPDRCQKKHSELWVHGGVFSIELWNKDRTRLMKL